MKERLSQLIETVLICNNHVVNKEIACTVLHFADLTERTLSYASVIFSERRSVLKGGH
jgi:hypothetical protein